MPDLLVEAEGNHLISQDGVHGRMLAVRRSPFSSRPGLAFIVLWKVASVVQVCGPAQKLQVLLLSVVGILTS